MLAHFSKLYQISTIFCVTHFRQSYDLDALCFQYNCLSAQFSKFYLISTIFCVTHFRQKYVLDELCFQYKCLSAQGSKFYQISTIFCVTHFRQKYGLDVLCFQYKCLSAQGSKFYQFLSFLRHLFSPELWPRCVMLSIYMFVSTNFKVLPNLYHFCVTQFRQSYGLDALCFQYFARNMASVCYAFNIDVCQHKSQISTNIFSIFCVTHFRQSSGLDVLCFQYKCLPAQFAKFYQISTICLRHSFSPELFP